MNVPLKESSLSFKTLQPRAEHLVAADLGGEEPRPLARWDLALKKKKEHRGCVHETTLKCAWSAGVTLVELCPRQQAAGLRAEGLAASLLFFPV